MKLALDIHHAPENLRNGLREIQKFWPHCFPSSGRPLRFEHEPRTGKRFLSVSHGSTITVRYAQPQDAYRALGCLLGEGDMSGDFTESCAFDMLGVMVDASRNGVPRVETVESLLRHMALMGLNTLMLYTEDTYEVPGRPFFGYLRGAYSSDEVARMDHYAHEFGIEMLPCIQTLAHLEQILQWPAFESYRDLGGVLLADDDRTYDLLGEMVHAASAPYRSHRIHLGMDEAHGLGSGRHRQIFGQQDPFAIFGRHLDRLRGICHSLGLQPMIWSDMYFRLGSKNDEYYDEDSRIPPAVAAHVPGDVELVYWDYYHTKASFYEEWIDRHRALGRDPIMAGGVWTWSRLWPALPFTLTTTEACMRACKNKGLRQAFVTLWGDDGQECDLMSAMPGLAFFAEHGYHESVDPGRMRANFAGICQADFDDLLKASEIEAPGALLDPWKSQANLGKLLLWQDPLLPLLEPMVSGHSLRDHYAGLASLLATASRRSPICGFAAQLSAVLTLKCDLRTNLEQAYRKRDPQRLRALQTGQLSMLREEVRRLWKLHRDRWLESCKPFGLEVLEARYGALLARLESLHDRLDRHLENPHYEIAELRADMLGLYATLDKVPLLTGPRMRTPSAIK